jgi:hypothetical protein
MVSKWPPPHSSLLKNRGTLNTFSSSTLKDFFPHIVAVFSTSVHSGLEYIFQHQTRYLLSKITKDTVPIAREVDHRQWWRHVVCSYTYDIMYIFNNLTGFVSAVINLHTANNLIFIIRGSLGDLRGNCGNDSMHSGACTVTFLVLYLLWQFPQDTRSTI